MHLCSKQLSHSCHRAPSSDCRYERYLACVIPEAHKYNDQHRACNSVTSSTCNRLPSSASFTDATLCEPCAAELRHCVASSTCASSTCAWGSSYAAEQLMRLFTQGALKAASQGQPAQPAKVQRQTIGLGTPVIKLQNFAAKS